jgi:hypothetical protein
MRLSSLVIPIVVLVSPLVCAQHSSSGGSSSGSSSSNGSHSSSSGGSASSHSSGSSASSISHSSSVATSHTSSTSPAHASSTGSAGARFNAQPSRPEGVGAIRESSAARLQGNKAAETSKNGQPEHGGFIAFLRHPFRKHEPKAAEADLRRPICRKGPCKEPVPAPPTPAESVLRKPVCKDKTCLCPPGEIHGPGGECVANTITNNYGVCAPGAQGNGVSCNASYACPPNQYWNGASCIARTAECASIEARAASLESELRGYRGRMQIECANNSSTQECIDLTQSHDGALARYRSLMNEAPVNCRSALPDPLSF